MLTRAQGFRAAFAVVNHPSLRERLVETVRGGLPSHAITEVTLDPDGEISVVKAIVQAEAQDVDAIFVYGLERLAPLQEGSPRFLELNLNRDHLWRAVRVPVVFWAPDFAIRAFSLQAPDLWSGRSGLYRFRPEAQDAAITSGETAVGFDWSLTPEERREREELLRDLLAEDEEEGGEPAARATTLQGLAKAAGMEGRNQDAIALYDQALATHRELGDRLGEANALQSLGDAALMQGRNQDAIALYEQALPIHREIGHRLGEATALVGYGAALQRTGSPSAVSVIEDAIRLFERLGLTDRAERARRLLDE